MSHLEHFFYIKVNFRPCFTLNMLDPSHVPLFWVQKLIILIKPFFIMNVIEQKRWKIIHLFLSHALCRLVVMPRTFFYYFFCLNLIMQVRPFTVISSNELSSTGYFNFLIRMIRFGKLSELVKFILKWKAKWKALCRGTRLVRIRFIIKQVIVWTVVL